MQHPNDLDNVLSFQQLMRARARRYGAVRPVPSQLPVVPRVHVDAQGNRTVASSQVVIRIVRDQVTGAIARAD